MQRPVNCPKCGSRQDQNRVHADCGSFIGSDGTIAQSEKCRILELEKRNAYLEQENGKLKDRLLSALERIDDLDPEIQE